MRSAIVSALPPAALPARELVEERRRLAERGVAGRPTRLPAAELTHQRLRLRHARHLVEIAPDLMLRLYTRVLGISLRGVVVGTTAWRGGEADVLMVAHGLLGEAAEHLVLLPTEALDPALHVLEHLSLDVGVAVVEVGVEAEGESVSWYVSGRYSGARRTGTGGCPR